jgi:hypothetical protein
MVVTDFSRVIRIDHASFNSVNSKCTAQIVSILVTTDVIRVTVGYAWHDIACKNEMLSVYTRLFRGIEQKNTV